MAQRDLINSLEVVHLTNLTLSGTTPASSDWVDTRDCNSVTFMVVTNTVTDAGTAAGFSFAMQENDDTTGAGATAVASTDIVGANSDLTVTSDSADDSIPGIVGYVGRRRYVRLTATGTTGTDADVSVVAIKHRLNLRNQGRTLVGTSVAAT